MRVSSKGQVTIPASIRDKFGIQPKAIVTYRGRGGSRSQPLPDFLIGAHAAVRGMHLLARDPARFGAYFPTVTVIEP